jgi:hypothetical protein
MRVEEVLRTAGRVVMEPALRLIKGEPHLWSERPLPTAPSPRSWGSRAARSVLRWKLVTGALFSPKIARDTG